MEPTKITMRVRPDVRPDRVNVSVFASGQLAGSLLLTKTEWHLVATAMDHGAACIDGRMALTIDEAQS